MAALTAAAVVSAGVVAAVSLKSAFAATSPAIAAQMTFASTFIFTPIIPIALVLIGLACLLPFLFGRNNHSYRSTPYVSSGYSGSSFYPRPPYSTTTSVFSDPHYHGHQNTGTVYNGHGYDNRTHGHDNHTHGHNNSSNNVHRR